MDLRRPQQDHLRVDHTDFQVLRRLRETALDSRIESRVTCYIRFTKQRSVPARRTCRISNRPCVRHYAQSAKDQSRQTPSRWRRIMRHVVEVDAKEVRIMRSKSVLLRTLVAASSAKTAGFEAPNALPFAETASPRSDTDSGRRRAKP